MAREMLKLRKGDSAIMIKSDGSIELAGVNDKPLMDDKGMISPVILFAALWAKKDQELLGHLVNNFKNCVREGYFGPDAQSDFKAMEVESAKIKLEQERDASSGVVTMEVPQTTIETNITDEEWKKHKKEEKILEQISAAGQDPKDLRQAEMMKAGAKKIEKKEFVGHKSHEGTVLDPQNPKDAAQILTDAKATPEQASEILNNAIEKQMLNVRDGQTVGNVTIEEGADNEDK